MAKSDQERDARLAAALRENLRRRKAQTRETGGRAARDREAPPQNKAATDAASE